MYCDYLYFFISSSSFFFVFFFNDTATTEIYTLSLHDALPNSSQCRSDAVIARVSMLRVRRSSPGRDRKSTRLNSSLTVISYAVFCLKKKKLDLTYLRQNTGPATVLRST